MSRGRGLIVSVLQNFFNSLKLRQVSGKLVGSDYLGNSYYEVKPPMHSSKSRPSRYILINNISHDEARHIWLLKPLKLKCKKNIADIKSQKLQFSRYYIPKDNDASKFDEPLPAEWEAWLRLRRREPPSTEEVAKNFQLMSSKKAKALAIDMQYKGIEDDDQVVTGIKNFPSYGEYEKYPGKGPGG